MLLILLYFKWELHYQKPKGNCAHALITCYNWESSIIIEILLNMFYIVQLNRIFKLEKKKAQLFLKKLHCFEVIKVHKTAQHTPKNYYSIE